MQEESEEHIGYKTTKQTQISMTAQNWRAGGSRSLSSSQRTAPFN